jgi:hypothetical protein
MGTGARSAPVPIRLATKLAEFKLATKLAEFRLATKLAEFKLATKLVELRSQPMAHMFKLLFY